MKGMQPLSGDSGRDPAMINPTPELDAAGIPPVNENVVANTPRGVDTGGDPNQGDVRLADEQITPETQRLTHPERAFDAPGDPEATVGPNPFGDKDKDDKKKPAKKAAAKKKAPVKRTAKKSTKKAAGKRY